MTESIVPIGPRLRRLREAAGISQFQLGQRVGIGNSSISSWEAGKSKPDVDQIKKIIDALGISWAALVDDSDVPFKKAVHELTERSLDDELRGRRNHHDQPSGEEAPGKIERLLVTA